MELVTLNITSLPWPLTSSRDFAEHPAHYPACDQITSFTPTDTNVQV